uniref:Uncharacterized protein n=1 Tax=Staphylococcus aureus TaxID=1280 RepID=Q8VVR1_STAAU|nr:hypothetical protein [Staphylococcus aureus]ACZ68512.1 hypothetical protein SAP057A_039 [Staphylococcus aureus]ARF19336.1 hypothetical protein [Staphylococcus aureus]ARF19388.1 hypothetical protein [Staphylococcus aureus]ARF19469.1 hypothetical protein [Staphylococcus aureus]ARF19516.1 hypothetical protein [Staphylococcus aureus]
MYFDINTLDIKNLRDDKYQFLEDSVTINNAYFLAADEIAINILGELFSLFYSVNLVRFYMFIMSVKRKFFPNFIIN